LVVHVLGGALTNTSR